MDEGTSAGAAVAAAPPPRRGARPSSDELFEAAVQLVSGAAGSYQATARRYSLCAADADDAYQRGLEILMTRAPTAERSELEPWLHTVIKHEAMALRRQRERLLEGVGDSEDEGSASSVPGPDEGAAERERVEHSAAALAVLKSSEVQCLLLKALGYSYDEIAERTGFSWTKVNRSLTEGRRRFFARFDQIESGRSCRRLQPLLSVVCDGEADPAQERVVRDHLRSCRACRAALRGYRSTPAQLAALIPPALVVPMGGRGSWWSRLYEALSTGASDRAAALGAKLQQAGELVTVQKTAVVVASTAAVAGGAVVNEHVKQQHPAHHRDGAARSAPPPRAPVAAAPVPAEAPATADETAKAEAGAGVAGGAGAEREAAQTSAAAEFGPEGETAAASEPVPAATSVAAPDTGTDQPPSRPRGSTSAATGGEFGP